ncbi:DUF5677 domain-containing protein [Candidatus Oleimmundimicrobium sp.]|uniref:DUF5677 domain-containing protein n=1 Tax=Candidatus Oleimmundimicrobium sp. TaxID=3060597 RepID=UPI0027200682|nr:DUF5677 domain-containing protein [Candidatus Oleimmundimicrobium sp.]MDO8886819.1 DUF5677 domain-containing protein [Candidatus Oleimmundimicrobium sp.]
MGNNQENFSNKTLKDFEKSLYKEHKKLFDHTDNLLKLADEWSEKEFEPTSAFERITILFFAKSRKTYWATRTLSIKGFGEDAGTLLRSLLENLIDLYWMSLDPQDRSKRFLDFASFMYREALKKLENDGHQDVLVPLEIKEEILNNYQKIDERTLKSFQKYRKWSPKNRREMAKEIDKALVGDESSRKNEFLFLYDKAYWLLSNAAHPNPINSDDFIVPVKGKLTLRAQPSKGHIATWLALSFHIFLKIIAKFNEIHELGEEQKIQNLKNKFIKDFGH